MPKKYTVKGTVIEENNYFKVIKPEEETNKKFYIFSKYDDTCWVCDKYKIVGSAVLQINGESKLYWNFINWQPHGQGRCLCYVIEIDGWKTKVVDDKEQTVVVYHDEKGFKFVRHLDEEGNLFKKKKEIKQTQEETVLV